MGKTHRYFENFNFIFFGTVVQNSIKTYTVNFKSVINVLEKFQTDQCWENFWEYNTDDESLLLKISEEIIKSKFLLTEIFINISNVIIFYA